MGARRNPIRIHTNSNRFLQNPSKFYSNPYELFTCDCSYTMKTLNLILQSCSCPNLPGCWSGREWKPKHRFSQTLALNLQKRTLVCPELSVERVMIPDFPDWFRTDGHPPLRTGSGLPGLVQGQLRTRAGQKTTQRKQKQARKRFRTGRIVFPE